MQFQNQFMNNLQLHGSSTSSGLAGSMQTAGAATEMRNSKLAISKAGMVNSLDSDYSDAQMFLNPRMSSRLHDQHRDQRAIG